MGGDDREVGCRRSIDGKDRCTWTGPLDQYPAHTAATAAAGDPHAACVVCSWPLTDHETRTCTRCVRNAHDDLTAIEAAYTQLATVAEHTGYHQGGLPGGDALVMLADGNITGGGPDDWLTDPTPVLAVLESNERDWRRTFGHGPAEAIATVTGCIGYLRRWLHYAARTYPNFDDYARELHELRSRLTHVVGMADDPEVAPAECFDCGGPLLRAYRSLRATIGERLSLAADVVASDERRVAKHQVKSAAKHPDAGRPKRLRVPARATRVRHAVAGDDREGLADAWQCARCRRRYKPAEYGLALRMRANAVSGWVPVRVAAETLRRSEQTVWKWQRGMEIPSACRVADQRIVVAWDAVKALSAATATRRSARAS